MKMKWDINGRGAAPKQPGEGGFSSYEGPDLPKGSWPVKLKRMTVGAIKAKGANHGKPRLSILLEVQTRHLDDESKHKYHGHPVWDGLNIIEGGEGFVNAFLHGLTDGSGAAKNAVESAFWDEDKGPDMRRVKVEKGPRAGQVDTHITKIGRYKIGSPNGNIMMQITSMKDTDQNGAFRASVTSYIPGVDQPDADDDSDVDDIDDDLDDDELDEDEDDGLGDVDEDADDDEGDGDDSDADEDESDDEDADDDDDDSEPDEPAPIKKAAPRKVTAGRKKQPF